VRSSKELAHRQADITHDFLTVLAPRFRKKSKVKEKSAILEDFNAVRIKLLSDDALTAVAEDFSAFHNKVTAFKSTYADDVSRITSSSHSDSDMTNAIDGQELSMCDVLARMNRLSTAVSSAIEYVRNCEVDGSDVFLPTRILGQPTLLSQFCTPKDSTEAEKLKKTIADLEEQNQLFASLLAEERRAKTVPAGLKSLKANIDLVEAQSILTNEIYILTNEDWLRIQRYANSTILRIDTPNSPGQERDINLRVSNLTAAIERFHKSVKTYANTFATA